MWRGPNDKLVTADAVDIVAVAAQRDCVRMLRGAIPRRHVRTDDTPSYCILPVQHHLSMLVAQRAQCYRVLAAG